VFAIPFVVLSVAALRWALRLRLPWGRTLNYLTGVPIAVVLILPLLVGSQLPSVYSAPFQSELNGKSLLGGRIGIPLWADIPTTYTEVLSSLSSSDSDISQYRVLWIPIDWRLMQFQRASDLNLLMYRSENSEQSRLAVYSAFTAIADDHESQIASLLADLNVKYVVIDLHDGQDRNSEPWQNGPRVLASVWDSKVLAGNPADYQQVLSKSPGMALAQFMPGWLVYRNTEWRPILQTYDRVLTLPSTSYETSPPTNQGPAIPLAWSAPLGVRWTHNSDGSIQINAIKATAGQTQWAPVRAGFTVVAGSSYRFMGTMNYQHVTQAHVKIVWHSAVSSLDAATYLLGGHDGTGVASFDQTVIAPAGATTAEMMLMGGWTQDQPGTTSYSGIAIRPLITPDLNALRTDPGLITSLWHELPDYLIEQDVQPSEVESTDLAVAQLAPFGTSPQTQGDQVSILAAANLRLTGTWAINAVPDRLGIEHFSCRGGSTLTVPAMVSKLAPAGSKVVWIQYKPGDTEPASGDVKSLGVSQRDMTIQCPGSGHTIANVLLVPPPTHSRFARYGYAHSQLLRTPDNAMAPTELSGDWANFYSPAPQGLPSALYDSSTAIRILGVVIGHLAALVGLMLGLVLRKR
jgi:hypothetical protein